MRMLVISGCKVYCRGQVIFAEQVIKSYKSAGWCKELKLSKECRLS